MVCPLCSSHTLEKIQAPQKLYYRCLTCDLIHIDPSHCLAPEEEKIRYGFHNNSLENKGYVDFLMQFIHFIPPELLTPKSAILDFGCGPTPVLSLLLEQQGLSPTLYDRYFFPETPWRRQKYQLILVHEVIEHIQNPAEYFKTWGQILAPSGRLIIRSHFHPQENSDFLKWWYILDNTHISFFSEKSYDYLEKQGLWTIEESDKKSMIILKKAEQYT
ncbi:MAG: class I SAM-dependent methyltransferase [Spirochaetales bacterium]|nr:class I SAM-dependent methyltransferase [Spirochaetales bacterium]